MLSQSRAWWPGLVYIAALALFLRFYDLPLKPLHHDEGVNTLFVTKLVRPPHAYTYDPSNYHGPTLFYFAWLSVSMVGFTTIGMRMVTAVAGLAMVLLVAGLRQHLGTRGALASAAMLASSSGAVYYARYFIHETLLACFTLAAIVSLVLWWSRRQSLFLYLGAVSVGVMFATKETAIISAVVIAVAAIGAAVLAELAPIAQTQRLVEGVRDRGGIGALTLATLLAVAVAMAFYTSFLANPRGAVAAIETFAFWSKTGTRVHTYPWYTYLSWLCVEEWPLLAAAVIGVVAAVIRRADRFASFAALWAAGMLVAYSVIPYKTPWLVLNMIVPLALCAGVAFEHFWSSRSRATEVLSWAVLLIAIGAGTARAAWLNFWNYDNPRSPYVYVHTSRQILKLLGAVERVETVHRGTSIAVMSRDYFPLPWYFREYPAGYHGHVVPTTAPIVIASVDDQRSVDAQLGAGYARSGPYLLRPGVLLLLYVRRDFQPPESGS